MIHTYENIGEPTEFLASYPLIIAGLEPGETKIFSGPDRDLFIERHQRSDASLSVADVLDGINQACGQNTHPANPILGNLYTAGYINVGHAAASWYPSPTYVNRLTESLGMRPGEDVLEFVHVEGQDKIKPRSYSRDYLAKGKFPQSAGKSFYMFSHDRTDDHATSVLLSPTEFTKGVIMATSRASRRNSKKVAGLFDHNTNQLRMPLHYYWKKITDPESVSEESDIIARLAYLSSLFWEIDDKIAGNDEAKRQHIGEVITRHLIELRPKLEALQAETVQAA